MKRLLSSTLVLALLITLNSAFVYGNTNVLSGSCGLNANYFIDSDGVLRITGTGVITKKFSETEGLDVKKIKKIELQEGITELGPECFWGCNQVTDINIPNSLINIDKQSMVSMDSLKNIQLPQGIQSIGKEAFRDCISLTKIELPDSITNVGEFAFDGCKNLVYVKLPKNISAQSQILWDKGFLT